MSVDEVIKTLKDLPLPVKDKRTLVIEPLEMKPEECAGDGAPPNKESDTVKTVTTETIAA